MGLNEHSLQFTAQTPRRSCRAQHGHVQPASKGPKPQPAAHNSICRCLAAHQMHNARYRRYDCTHVLHRTCTGGTISGHKFYPEKYFADNVPFFLATPQCHEMHAYLRHLKQQEINCTASADVPITIYVLDCGDPSGFSTRMLRLKWVVQFPSSEPMRAACI